MIYIANLHEAARAREGRHVRDEDLDVAALFETAMESEAAAVDIVEDGDSSEAV